MEVTWIITAFGLGMLAHFSKLPPLIGYLAAGLLLKFNGFEINHTLEFISHTGVLLLLFTVGLKLRLKNLIRAEVMLGSIIQLLIMSGIYFALITLISDVDYTTMLILAIALSFSSTVVAAKVLEQKKELRAFHGRVAIGILIMQDIVAVVILSFTGNKEASLWGLLVFAIPLIKPLIHKLVDWAGHDELLTLYGLVLAVALGGAGFDLLGLSSELGALLFGIILSDHTRSSELSKSLWNLKDIFLIGFFLQIGMSALPDMNNLFYAALLVLVLPVKVFFYFIILLIFRLRSRTAFLASISLATYSEFGLIIAHLGVQANWFPVEWLATLAFAVALSFLVSAPLNRYTHNLYARYEKPLCRFQTKRRHRDDAAIYLGSALYLVVGMGRVGTGAYDYMKQQGQQCVGLDSDHGQIEKHLVEGRRVLYADAEDPGFWQNLHLGHIQTIMLALPDLEANLYAVNHLRARGFSGLIYATGTFPEHIEAILAAGADDAYNYYDDVGVGFGEHVWEKTRVDNVSS